MQNLYLKVDLNAVSIFRSSVSHARKYYVPLCIESVDYFYYAAKFSLIQSATVNRTAR